METTKTFDMDITAPRRKIAVPSAKKINVRYQLSDETYVTFGFISGTLDFEMRFCKKDGTIGFNPNEWDAITPRLGPLSGWSAGSESTNFEATLLEGPDATLKACAYNDTLHFTLTGTRGGQLTLNAMEAYELFRKTNHVTEQLTKLKNHKLAIEEMLVAINCSLIEAYETLNRYKPMSNDYYFIDEEDKFDSAYSYFTNYVSPFKVISTYEATIKQKNIENDFQTYNIFTILLGQLPTLKECFKNREK